MSLLFDDFRKKWVEDTPEEKIRQRFLTLLVEQKGFPKNYIAVEKKIENLSGLLLEKKENPRRLDIVCYFMQKKEVSILLLVECKQKISFPKDLSQILGYNERIKAPFFALVEEKGFFLFHQKQEEVERLPSFLSYAEMVEKAL